MKAAALASKVECEEKDGEDKIVVEQKASRRNSIVSRTVSIFFITESPVTCVLQLLFGIIAFVSTHMRSELWSPYDKGKVFSVAAWTWCPKDIYCIDGGSGGQVFFGILSRMAAGGMYPVLALTISMMAHSSMYWIQGRARVRVGGGLFLMNGGVKEIHQRCGIVFGRLVLIHGFAHCCRFALRGELKWMSCLPMILAAFLATTAFCLLPVAIYCLIHKTDLRYGKAMIISHHLLVFIGIIGSMAHHRRLAAVLIAFVVLWSFDKLYFVLMLSHSVDSPYFTALPHGVLATFETPKGLKYKTGDYVKVAIPWLPKPFNSEFHPYSIIGVGTHSSMLYMQLVESPPKVLPNKKRDIETVSSDTSSQNWTGALRDYVLRRGSCGASRPIVIAGPYSAPFSTSISHRYLLVVASGVGITPCLSTISKVGKDRHIILLWASRDVALVRIFAEYICGNTAEAIIYLTGPAANEECDDLESTSFLSIKRGRPNVEALVGEILDGGHKIFYTDDGDGDLEQSILSDPVVLASDSNLQRPHQLARSKSNSFVTRPSMTRLKSGIHAKILQEGAPQPYVAPKNMLNREIDDQPLNPHEFKVLYCGGSIGIRDSIAKACYARDADFTSEVF